jgi:hypothetical protein
MSKIVLRNANRLINSQPLCGPGHPGVSMHGLGVCRGHRHEPGSLSCLSQPTATTSDRCNCSASSPCVAPTLGLGG